MEQPKTQKFNIADLNPAKYNPRKQLMPGDPEFEALCRSIETFGCVSYVVVNVRDGANVIVSGHQRISAMRYLGYEEAECVVVDLDEPQEMALNVAMNKISGEWDMEKLKALLKDIDLSGLDMTLTGFDEEELKGLIGDVPLGEEAFEDSGFYLSGCCIWERSEEGGYPYRQSHDTCLYGWKAKGKHRWFSDRKQTTVWEFADTGTEGKPIALMAYPMRISSPKDAKVLDPFGGYGSTLMAAEQTGRTAYIAEPDTWFASAIVRRYIASEGRRGDLSFLRRI